MTGLFITGTDTGVGKSLVACALLAGFSRLGLRTAAMKPVASGCEITPLGLRNQDALQLAARTSCTVPYETLNPYAFQPAIAPHIAADQTGISMDGQHIAALYKNIAAQADICVVEGAGGWLVPLNRTETMADLVAVLDLPVVLVVGMRLGCLNHALLTAESISARGVSLAGWVANQIVPDMDNVDQNIETLHKYLPGSFLGIVEYTSEPLPENVAECLDVVGLMEHIVL